jgi:hypothetical protein
MSLRQTCPVTGMTDARCVVGVPMPREAGTFRAITAPRRLGVLSGVWVLHPVAVVRVDRGSGVTGGPDVVAQLQVLVDHEPPEAYAERGRVVTVFPGGGLQPGLPADSRHHKTGQNSPF